MVLDETNPSHRPTDPLVKRLLHHAVHSVAAAAALLPLHASAGDTMLKLLAVLKDRGSISEAEYRMLVQVAEEESRSVTGPPATHATPPAPTHVPAPTPSTATPAVESTMVSNSAPPEQASASSDRRERMREKTDQTSTSSTADAVQAALKGKWYEKINLRGYAQIRYENVIDPGDGPTLNVPNDSAASESSSFMVRRGRVILSGDATSRLFVYAQADFNSSLSSGEYTLGMRDYYGDLALDPEKEFRLRFGQSKVPFGWSNLQSSQNRAPMERADAINSTVEGERDIGVFGYWAPDEIRKRFRDLVRLGLKGSGDYGVVGVGAYSGQGLNRLDVNGEPHLVARLSYPWKLANGQYVEAGLQAHHGKYVSGVGPVNLGGGAFTPSRPTDGITDQRLGASFVWYPQPFGVEAEWNVGRGPELDSTRREIRSQFLHGGYVQLAYRSDAWHGDWYPFARWQFYDGGRKFAQNAPHDRVNELDVGLEWQPWPEFEFTVSYTRTFQRTNTRVAPFGETEGADRIAFQAQINY